MTNEELSNMWKKEIAKSLAEMPELLKRLHPVEFSSGLWEVYRGAYGDIREDVAFLFCPKELLPEMGRIRRLDFEEKGDDQVVFDNLCENLSHQLSFYEAAYLALPYLVLFLEKKRREGDFKWQMEIIMETGVIMSTDFPENHGEWEESVPEDILESYRLAKELFKEMTKEFIWKNMDLLKKEEQAKLEYFCTGILAIFDAPKAAFQLLLGNWEQCAVECKNCGYYNEDMEIDDEEQIKEIIEPAMSVIGKWDQKGFDDTYLWFNNLVHMFGIENEWKIPYFYGTYTCPECGRKGILIEWMA